MDASATRAPHAVHTTLPQAFDSKVVRTVEISMLLPKVSIAQTVRQEINVKIKQVQDTDSLWVLGRGFKKSNLVMPVDDKERACIIRTVTVLRKSEKSGSGGAVGQRQLQ